MPKSYTVLGAMLNLGVAPKLALNDGQKWVVVRHSKFARLNFQNRGKKCPQMT